MDFVIWPLFSIFIRYSYIHWDLCMRMFTCVTCKFSNHVRSISCVNRKYGINKRSCCLGIRSLANDTKSNDDNQFIFNVPKVCSMFVYILIAYNNHSIYYIQSILTHTRTQSVTFLLVHSIN